MEVKIAAQAAMIEWLADAVHESRMTLFRYDTNIDRNQWWLDNGKLEAEARALIQPAAQPTKE